MQFTISAATLLALVAAAQAQTAGFDPITTPTKNEAVAACANYAIKWQYTSTYAGTVTLQLLQGATPTTLQLGPVLASGIDNSLGTYSWPVDCALGSDATYGIKIIYDGDATGVTFQYSNPFSITRSTSSSSSSAAAASATSPAATTAPAAAAANQANAEASTVYQTQYTTITSCAATVTDCPARSTFVSMTSSPLVASAPLAANSVSTAVSPMTTGAPISQAGNATLLTNTTTGAARAVTTSSVVTAGAVRVAMGGVALFAGVVAAVFAL